MAFIAFDISTISTASTTAVAVGEGPRIFYGSLFGVTGYWVRGPSSMAPIGYITSSASAKLTGEGVFTEQSSTGSLIVERASITVSSYKYGDRWFRLSASVTGSIGAKTLKRLILRYKSVDEYGTVS